MGEVSSPLGSTTATVFTFLSLAGLLLLAAITIAASPPPNVQNTYLSWLSLVLLAIIDVFGIFAAIFPMRCARILRPGLRKEFAQQKGERNPMPIYEGHHPPCSGFHSHVITISARKYCAGCTGLALGALLSLTGIALLLGGLNSLPFTILFWLGFALVLIAQLQHLLPLGGFIRLAISLGFSFGAFMMLAGADGLVSSAFLNFYCLSLIAFLIVSRTVISRESHAMICSSCQLERCVLYD